jgi:4-hydroxybenzoate polyprenyltransferase
VSLNTYLLIFLSSLILIIQIYLFDGKEYKKNAKLFALNNYYGLSIFFILLIATQNG